MFDYFIYFDIENSQTVKQLKANKIQSSKMRNEIKTIVYT